MYPLLFDIIPSYFALWLIAAVVCIAFGRVLAERRGFPGGRSVVALLGMAFILIVGSKLLYLAETIWFPSDDFAPPHARGVGHGFRLPGGVLLLTATLPIVAGYLGLPWKKFGDSIIPVVALAVVFLRLGCFLNGCCFGKLSDVPWAVTFPEGTWAYWLHATEGRIPRTALSSLPVHPLQIYFALVGSGIFLFLVALQRHPRIYDGRLQLIFYTLFFSTTALLEPLRENYLTLNNILVPFAAIVAAGILYGKRRSLLHENPFFQRLPPAA